MAILTGDQIEAMRRQAGPREPDRDTHYELCSGIDCPCFKEGGEVRAHNHWSMLMWFAQTDPDLVRRVLNEAENNRAREEAFLNGSEENAS